MLLYIIIFSVWYLIGFISFLYFTHCVSDITVRHVLLAFPIGFTGLYATHNGLIVGKGINVFNVVVLKKKQEEIKLND